MTTSTLPDVTTISLSVAKARVVRLIGLLGVLGAIALIVGGALVWGLVSSQLTAEKITVSDNAAFLAGAPVAGPFSAFAQADVIQTDALKVSGGKTFAELSQDDPIRPTVESASSLRASLFTSVISFGVSALAIGLGLLVGLFGWAVMTLVPSVVRPKPVTEATAEATAEATVPAAV